MSQQQTVLRVEFDNVNSTTGITQYDFLDLYSSIPILVNKSFAELGDIAKKNSDYTIGVLLPGSKKNNKFFENYFNVDTISLYFNPNKKVPCQVLITDEPQFTGYMRLNRVSVLESKIEYDVTLFSTVGELLGSIGNNLLKDLNYSDTDYNFNHQFNLDNVTRGFTYDNFSLNQEAPYPYFYPVVHNGYLYTGDTVNFSGGTILERTNLYTSTGPLGSYATLNDAYTAGVQQYRINSPTQGVYNNQLKPGLSVWNILKLMFKTYGYSITSDFFNTPWVKSLYMYGYFSSDSTKFSFAVYEIQTLPLEGVEVFFVNQGGQVLAVVAKLGTGIPCFCDSDINIRLNYANNYSFNSTIPYGTSGSTYDIGQTFVSGSSPQVPNGTSLSYLPIPIGEVVPYVDGDFVDFSLSIDYNIKQIDILSSFAKKFNLVLIPDQENPYNIIIEPYDYYIGTGDVHNWTDRISYDKGFTVEPALNYIESELQFTDQEDGDEGNRLFKINNNRIYGQNYVYNPTDFKSQEKRIETTYSPQLIRKWDPTPITGTTGNIGLPLGINYAGSNNQISQGTTETVNWIYKGVKTKPKLFFWLGCQNPFLDVLGETYNAANFYKTYNVYVQNSSGSTYYQLNNLPVISHTMPMGNPDKNKINNDSQCILFNSEYPTSEALGIQEYNTYTENDAYNSFYEGRISNLYNPNTRVLNGYFSLSYADIKNLFPQDLIKVNEQHFVVSKIDSFNLTNKELTKVQLIQYNGQPNTYIDRYFQYYYCDNPSVIYNFKTDFTNPNLLNTNYGWSLYYDHQIGTLGGTQSGFTSTFKDTIGGQDVYIPYFIYEVNESTYNSSEYNWECDTLRQHIYSQPYGPFINSMPTFWVNSGATQTGINLFTNCANFESARTTYGILTGSSITYGTSACISPTPTPTITTTPTVTPTISLTPSITPTNTITPTVTPTYTPTVTPTNTVTPTSFNCVGYSVANNGAVSATIQYTDCFGIIQTVVILAGLTQIIGALFGLIQCILGDCDNVTIGLVPTPTPTNTPTNTVTPTVTPTITVTPSATPAAVNIIQNDLLVYVDGGQYQSYSGTGTTWKSLVTGTTYNGTLINGPGYYKFFDSQIGGFVFNRYQNLNQSCYFGDSSGGLNTVSKTFGGWCILNRGSTILNTIYLRGGSNWSLRIEKHSNNKFAVVSMNNNIPYTTESTTEVNSSYYFYVIGKWDGNRTYIYINGQLENSIATSGSLRNSSEGWRIGIPSPSSTDPYTNISDFQLYERALSNEEILYNFNAKKAIYGY